MGNRQLVLRSRPVGMVRESDFELVEAPVPEPPEGGAVVKVRLVSLDPAMRGWLDGREDSYLPPVGLGEVMRAGGVGEVVATADESRWPVGALVSGLLGWAEYATVSPGLARVVPAGITPEQALGVLGTTGQTAYWGMLDLGRPRPGETVVVSGAAGATGSVAGQIAKIQGARVVGIAGGPAKCDWVRSLGFDDCIDYKGESVPQRLAQACPDGVDVFFDNVGGAILEAVLDRINLRARIVLCGGISTYNDVEPSPGPRNLLNLVIKRARMEGFIVLDYLPRSAEAMADLQRWLAEGRVNDRVDVAEGGLEAAVPAFNRLFSGLNTGKLLLRIS